MITYYQFRGSELNRVPNELIIGGPEFGFHGKTLLEKGETRGI
jgi:hypothetical protein